MRIIGPIMVLLIIFNFIGTSMLVSLEFNWIELQSSLTLLNTTGAVIMLVYLKKGFWQKDLAFRLLSVFFFFLCLSVIGITTTNAVAAHSVIATAQLIFAVILPVSAIENKSTSYKMGAK